MNKIDPTKPLEFENGARAYYVATVTRGGSLWDQFTGKQEHAEVYAELYEQGVRFMVASQPDKKKGGCIDEYGRPVTPHDNSFWGTSVPVRNGVVRPVDHGAMPDSALWGMF